MYIYIYIYIYIDTNSRIDLPGPANHVIRPKTTRLVTSFREELLYLSKLNLRKTRSTMLHRFGNISKVRQYAIVGVR